MTDLVLMDDAVILAASMALVTAIEVGYLEDEGEALKEGSLVTLSWPGPSSMGCMHESRRYKL